MSEHLIDVPALPTPSFSTVTGDSETRFLDGVAVKAYSGLKRQYEDISIGEIRATADLFRGAHVKDYIPILLPRQIDAIRRAGIVFDTSTTTFILPPQPQESI